MPYGIGHEPKHTRRCAKEWFNVNGVDVMRCPAQSLELNHIENLCSDIKKKEKKNLP